MRVRLVQLPAIPSLGVYPTYRLAAGVQELIRRQFLDTKGGAATVAATAEQQDAGKLPLRSSLSPPPPTVIAFTPSPTYTLGRRQTSATLTATDLAGLRAPLTVCPPRSGNGEGDGDGDGNGVENVGSTTFTPAVEEAPRGGLMTYHGPGQAVLWPVFDLKAPAHRQFTVRAYSRLLETVTAEVLQKRFGLAAYTTPDAGLWVRSPGRGGRSAGGDAEEQKEEEEEEERKIAALGVHLRRNIAALGVAVNLNTPVTRYGGATEPPSSLSSSSPASPADATAINPWVRFVPCGIDGKGVSSVADEGRLRFGRVPAAWDLDPVSFAAQWATAFAVHLGLEPDIDVADGEAVTQLIDQAKKRLYAAAQREATER